MKKLYSFVLMAMMLLIGTNAWANYPANWLQEQFDAVQAGGQTVTITMEDDIILEVPVYLGTASVDDPRKSIILDMNGHHITMDATTWVSTKGNVFCSMFTITHGELLIRNNNKSVTSTISMTGKGYDYTSNNTRNLAQYNNIFNVAGSYKSSRWVKSGNTYVIDEDAAINTRDEGWFTHLEIGEGVKVVAENTIYGAGISIDGYYTNYHAMISKDDTYTTGVFDASLNGSRGNVCLYNRSDAPAYNTVVLAGNTGEGVAYGVRVDVYGDIEFATAATEGKAYGIKLNGGLKSSLKAGEKFWKKHCWSVDQAYAATYGATSTSPDSYSIGADAYEAHKLDTVDAPFLYIHRGAHIIAAAELNEATAVYCSGYGKTLIEGACSGNSGVNVKSGKVEMHDAEITGTATSYSNAQQGNHATGSGGVVVNSVNNRAGDIEVVISGDTKVSTNVGYAIEEVVNKTGTGAGHTDVSSIEIQGGTIEGGDKGAIAITTEGAAATEITGGNVTGKASVDNIEVNVSTLVPQNTDYHTTEVTINGKTVIVVSEGSGPGDEAKKTTWSEIADLSNEDDPADVAWTAVGEGTISTNLYFGELQMISGTDASNIQKLTIKNDATLTVKHLMMNNFAQIIVEAGGKLIVTGEQGIVAPVTSNIVLESTATKHATFLFHPNVTSNKYPKATVELTSKAYKKSANENVWQRFAVPTHVGYDVHRNDMDYDHTAYPTAIYKRVYSPDGWQVLAPASNEVYVPFMCYNMTTNVDHVGAVYTFECELAGNVNAELPLLGAKWTYYGNSYTAPIDIAAMINNVPSHISRTVYVHNVGEDYWDAINMGDVEDDDMAQELIQPMQAFVYQKVGEGANSVLDYENWVYNPAMGIVPNNPAPARRANGGLDYQRASIVMQAEDGTQEVAKLYLGANFANSFDNGYDAEKLMSENHFNMYLSTEEGQMSHWATDGIENATINMQTKQATSYTMNFNKVTFEGYAVKDNLTGTIVEIKNGNFYHFSTLANSNIEGRFQIVKANEVITAIDNLEEVSNIKGIYSLTGQYLGEDFNALPSGVYVVNGKKMVK